jgi:hypothetical protein
MADTFADLQPSINAPARKAFAVTTHNTNELAVLPREVYVGGAGDLTVILADDTVAVTYYSVPAGTTLSIRPKIIKATGTTATNIVGHY